MEDIISTLLEAARNGGSEALAVIGWCLYVVERYYIAPKRDAEHKAEIKQYGEDFKELAQQGNSVITKFTVVLEVIKDRMGRGNG